MEKTSISEKTEQLLKSFQEGNQTVVEGMVAVQEGNVQVAQSVLTDWIETLKSQTENAQMLVREIEQQAHKQQEAFQRLAQQSVDSYFDVLHASYSSFAPSLTLTENLQNCLLALASRCPYHIVDINEQVLGPQSLGAAGWTATDLIEFLESTAPHVLQTRARLEKNAQRKGIYLLEVSEEIPAFWIHCAEVGEKMPAYRGNKATRQQQQTARGEAVPVLG